MDRWSQKDRFTVAVMSSLAVNDLLPGNCMHAQESKPKERNYICIGSKQINLEHATCDSQIRPRHSPRLSPTSVDQVPGATWYLNRVLQLVVGVGGLTGVQVLCVPGTCTAVGSTGIRYKYECSE